MAGRATWTRRSSGSSAAPTRPARRRELELRPVFELEDFGDSVTPELREQDERLRSPDRGSSRSDTPAIPNRAIEAVWRIESARLIAGLTRIVRDVGLAEELSQDALVAALEQWPESGVPDNPGAWLMATAKHRAIDLLRRSTTLERKQEELAREIELQLGSAERRHRRRAGRPRGRRPSAPHLHGVPPGPVDARRALRSPCACSAGSPPTRSREPSSSPSRRSRSASCGRSERSPRRASRSRTRPARSFAERLSSVLEVIYLIFNEGYSATAGDDWLRPALCEEALRLGRILAGLAPEEPEVHGLVALMEIQASRSRARVGPGGEPVLLLDQDRARWDRVLVGRGLAALERAERARRLARPVRASGGDRRLPRPGPQRRGDRLGANRGALRRPLRAQRVAGRGAEPSGGGGNGVRPGRRPASWWTSWWWRGRSTATTCCRACAATCSRSSAATRRRAPSSSWRPR